MQSRTLNKPPLRARTGINPTCQRTQPGSRRATMLDCSYIEPRPTLSDTRWENAAAGVSSSWGGLVGLINSTPFAHIHLALGKVDNLYYRPHNHLADPPPSPCALTSRSSSSDDNVR